MKYITPTERIRMLQHENETLRARIAEIESVANIVFVKMVERGEIDEQTAMEHIDIFSPWLPNESYRKGEYRKYEGELYRCISDQHDARDYFTPDKAVRLWEKISSSTETYSEWSQPICEIDGYNIGDRVTYNNARWRSIRNHNVQTPGGENWVRIY